MLIRIGGSRLPAVLAALVASAAVPAQDAQHARIEEVIVSGSLSRYSALKSDTPIMETARSVSIETLDQILDKGALVLDDTFTYSAGVTGETYGFATRVDSVKVRGLTVPQYQDRLQSLFGNYNNARPEIYTLEQVEILKGPASVLYGKGSPGGLVNVVSKLPRQESATEIVAEYGNYDRKQLALDTTGTLDGDGRWLYRLVGVYRDTDTQVDYVGNNAVVFAPSVTFRPTDRTNLTMLFNYTDTEGDTAAQFLPLYGTLFDAPNGKKIDSSFYAGEEDFNKFDTRATSLTLLADHQFNDVWALEVTARYTDASADYQQAWTSFIGGDRFIRNADGSLYQDGTVPRTFYRQDSTSEQAAIDTRLRASFDTGGLGHDLLLGLQYQEVTTGGAGYYDFATSGPDSAFGDRYWINLFNPVYGNVPPDEYFDALYAEGPDTDSLDQGIYINDQISVEAWRITLGLRYDETRSETEGAREQKDDAVSGAAGVLYQFENGLSPYASYAQSFEPVIGDNGNGQPLKPQEGEQLEFGIKYEPLSFPAIVTLAWFDLEQSNLSDPSALPGTVQQQSGVADVAGVEFELQAQLGDVSVEFNASHILVETEEEAQALIEALDGGADFAELAQEKSTGPSGPNGGQLGWFGPGMMVPEFENAVAGMEPGEVSAPVQTQFGWHVIKLNETRDQDIPELDEVRAELEAMVRNAAVEAEVDRLTGEADISRTEVEVDPALIRQTDLLEE